MTGWSDMAERFQVVSVKGKDVGELRKILALDLAGTQLRNAGVMAPSNGLRAQIRRQPNMPVPRASRIDRYFQANTFGRTPKGYFSQR